MALVKKEDVAQYVVTVPMERRRLFILATPMPWAISTYLLLYFKSETASDLRHF